VIGVLATAGTLCSEKYLTHKEKYAGDIHIAEHVGEGFVELVESGTVVGPAAEEVVIRSLKPLLDAGADTIVLGCTHYPFLSETIAKVAFELYPEREVRIIDPAPAVAKHLKDVMQEEDLLPCDGDTTCAPFQSVSGTTILHSSGNPATLEKFFNLISAGRELRREVGHR
jgi:glutamate racemase